MCGAHTVCEKCVQDKIDQCKRSAQEGGGAAPAVPSGEVTFDCLAGCGKPVSIARAADLPPNVAFLEIVDQRAKNRAEKQRHLKLIHDLATTGVCFMLLNTPMNSVHSVVRN
jgi:hypothetical protein